MGEKRPLCPHRLRKINGSFAFIEHRFLRDGFWASLNHHELLLYLFLVIVADRKGLSYYSYDKICNLLKISIDKYILARNSLIEKDLIAFDGKLFQVLSLPERVVHTSLPLSISILFTPWEGAVIDGELTHAIRDYLQWMVSEGYAPRTCESYGYELNHFLSFVNDFLSTKHWS